MLAASPHDWSRVTRTTFFSFWRASHAIDHVTTTVQQLTTIDHAALHRSDWIYDKNHHKSLQKSCQGNAQHMSICPCFVYIVLMACLSFSVSHVSFFHMCLQSFPMFALFYALLRCLDIFLRDWVWDTMFVIPKPFPTKPGCEMLWYILIFVNFKMFKDVTRCLKSFKDVWWVYIFLQMCKYVFRFVNNILNLFHQILLFMSFYVLVMYWLLFYLSICMFISLYLCILVCWKRTVLI